MDAKDFMPDESVIAGIRSDVAAYEVERAKAHAAVRWRVPVFLGLLVLAVLIVAWIFNGLADPFEQWTSTPHVVLYVAAFFAAFWVWSWAMSPATQLQQSFRSKVLPVIFGFIEGVNYSNGRTPTSFDRLPREVSGSFNRQAFDDIVAGRYGGFPFELYEATLSQKAGKSTSQVFKGVIVAFETIVPFPGLLVAARKVNVVVGFFRGLFGASLVEIQSGVPALDEAYEFRTNNAEAAQPLVTGRLAQALGWLRETWPEQPARLALNGSDGFLLIPVSKNFFELPAISVPVDYQTHVAPMIADMAALLATVSLVRKIGMQDDVPAGG